MLKVKIFASVPPYAEIRIFIAQYIQSMAHQLVDDFNAYRAQMNERIAAGNNKVINRLFNLDTNTYAEGALDVKTKEMLGLVASMALRCDD